MQVKKILFYSLMSLVFVGCGGGNGNGDNSKAITIVTPDPFTAPTIDQSTKNDYLKAVNDARSQTQDCGTKGIKAPVLALKWNDALYLAAAEHNEDMLTSNIIDEHHRGSGTDSDYTKVVQSLNHASYFQERIENNGYKNWSTLLENLTVGDEINDSKKAVEKWLKSDGHCANLMDPDVTEMGMAYKHQDDAKYKNYWTQDFGGK